MPGIDCRVKLSDENDVFLRFLLNVLLTLKKWSDILLLISMTGKSSNNELFERVGAGGSPIQPVL